MNIIRYQLEMGSTLITILFILAFNSYIFDASSITIGGFLLVFGAMYVYVGNVFYSIINYTIADACWLYNAYENGDLFGAVMVTIGIITGLIVTNKMRVGEFRKSVRKDNEIY